MERGYRKDCLCSLMGGWGRMLILDLILAVFLLGYCLLLVYASVLFLTLPNSWTSHAFFETLCMTMVICWAILLTAIFFDFFKRDWGWGNETDRETWKEVFGWGFVYRGWITATAVYYLNVIRNNPLNNLTAWCLQNKWTRQCRTPTFYVG